ncbi:MMPL family transporter [Salinithrix halophila]|uniref:MMPL family transporter n=1 Tax=Salinithrix halophila TaxID=1485204 RepID=A0ABV8JDZ5_9BACL
MRRIIRLKWFILLGWAAVALLALVTMPDLGELTREKGTPEIPDRYSSQVAEELTEKELTPSSGGNEMTVLAVFHSDGKMTREHLREVETTLKALEADKELGVNEVLTHFKEKELEERFLSKDRSTVLASLTVDRGERTVEEVRTGLDKALAKVSVDHYLTGSELINEDFARTTLDGVRKTEVFTVAFIIIVLILVFRSPVAPLVSLVTVAFAYVVSLGTVAHLVDQFDFPFANFTQIFLVLVLFGIGTDYNILLFSRFKEELNKRKSVAESIVVTYKTAGKTVFYSGLAVLIGFSCLGLAQFSIYQAGVAVAIGIFFLWASLVTLGPVFMSLIGAKLFWPVKTAKRHRESRIWAFLSAFSYRRPLPALLIVTLVTVPVLFFYEGKLSYDSLEEVDESYSSVKGFDIVADEFKPGQTMPAQVVWKNDQPLDSKESLAFIDQITEAMEQSPGVDTVYGPTRPKGEPIRELYVQNQTKQTKEGLEKAGEGAGDIQKGLDKASQRLEGGDRDFSRAGELITGTQAARAGIGDVNRAMREIQAGFNQGAAGAEKIHSGLTALRGSMKELSVSTDRLHNGYNELYKGYQTFGGEYRKVEMGVAGLQPALIGLKHQVAALRNKPGMDNDPDIRRIEASIDGLIAAVNRLDTGFKRLNREYGATNRKFAEVNAGLKRVTSGQKRMVEGLDALNTGSAALVAGLKKGTAGQSQVTEALSRIKGGLGKVNTGQKKLFQGLGTLDDNLSKLQNGLASSSNGLGSIEKGLREAEGYLGDLSGSDASRTFFVPKKVREGKEFRKALDAYMSDDRRTMQWNIVLNGDPYSEGAMETAADLDRTVAAKLQNTDYEDGKFGIGGISSQNRDLKRISTSDFNRTALLMLAGISLVLLWILRSFWNTVYIIGSLILSYFTALTTTELIFSDLLGYPGLTWTVPFFSLIMVVSLGVDYSIFLMMRYLEYRHLTPGEAIIEASKNIGGVVFSAAVILSGTFAALYPSGVLTLLQIATVVIIGLFLLAVLILPVFLPAMFSITRRLAADPDRRGIPDGEGRIDSAAR